MRPPRLSSLLSSFLAALRFLTLVGIREPVPTDRTTLGRAGAFFPLIGLVIGGLAWTADRLLRDRLPSPVLGVVLVGLLAALSRGGQLRGLRSTADALWRRSGVPVLAVALAGKLWALTVLHGGPRDVALLLAPMLGRWACVVMAYSSRPVPGREEGDFRDARVLVRDVHFNDFGLASLVALGVLFTLTEAVGIALAIPLGGLIIGGSLYCNRRLGGADGHSVAGLGELVETAALCLIVLLAASG